MANVAGIPVWREVGTTPIPSEPDTGAIVIVGGGPIGLAAALDLGQRGHQIIVLNRMDFIANGSKAICFSKRSLDIFDRLGVADRMIEKGVVWETGKVFWGDRPAPIYQFNLRPVSNQKHPAFINLQQYYVEEYLIDALADLPNVEIRWGHEAIALERNGDGVTLAVSALDERYDLSCQWVVACDGCKSAVRSMLGLDFEGRVFEDNFLIADVKFEQERPSERWFWFDPPFNRGQSALLHKQPDNVWRLDFQLGWDVDRESCVEPHNVEPFVRGMVGADVEFKEEWYSVYTFQCRRMARFVHGRVVFAGDSAHLVSPFGARGCNGGLADIDNLCWKLDAVVTGKSPDALLETYNQEAIETADENILNSSRSTDFLTPKSSVSAAFRDAVLELSVENEFARPFVNSGRLSTPISYQHSELSTIDEDCWDGGVPPGAPALDAPQGSGWLIDKLGWSFVLISNGETDTDLPCIDISSDPLALHRYALTPGGTTLIRPDQYVAARWKHPTRQKVAAAISKASCHQLDGTFGEVSCH